MGSMNCSSAAGDAEFIGERALAEGLFLMAKFTRMGGLI